MPVKEAGRDGRCRTPDDPSVDTTMAAWSPTGGGPIVLLAALLALLPAPAPAQEAGGAAAPEAGPRAPEWEVRPPADLGLDRERLGAAYRRAGQLDPLNGLLVARRGTLVAEQYWNGMSARRDVNVKSASKSVISALVGIALREGVIDGLDQRVVEFFPEYVGEDADPRKREVTVRDLLTMRSGLESTSFENYGRWVAGDDWVRGVLEQPVVADPGGRFIYSTGSSHLLSAILARASGSSTLEFARRHLFGPLGIEPGGWQRDPQGYYFGGNNLSLSPREMRRFGELYLNLGRWEGEQVLPEDWVRESWRVYTHSRRHGYGFGYYWWTRELAGHPVHYAWGYGGQFIFVVPDLEMVVVTTSTNRPENRGGGSHLRDIYELLRSEILPAAD